MKFRLFTHGPTLVLAAVVCLGPFATDSQARIGDCGYPITSGKKPTATDALGVLRAAIGSRACEVCTCDVDGSGSIAATDALQVLLVAVGNSSALDCEPCPGAVAPPEVVTRGSAGGFVVQVNPVFVVDDPANAPPGSTVVEGASVRAYDRFGKLVGETTTGADGSFALAGLPTGLTEIEIRLDPGAADPDLVVRATIVPEIAVALGRTYPVSREDATTAALQGVPATALVAGSLNPFPADTALYPKGSATDGLPQNSDVEKFAAQSWFFFVNLEPLADFTHPAEFVLVDADTGDVTRIPTGFPPVVNHGALWTSTDALYRYFPEDLSHLDPPDYPDGAEAVPTAEVVQTPEIPDVANLPDEYPAPLGEDTYDNIPALPVGEQGALSGIASSHFNNLGADGVFVVYILTGNDSHFEQNIARLGLSLFLEGVPYANTGKADLSSIPPPPDDTAGEDSQQATDTRKAAVGGLLRDFVLAFEPQIQARLDQGKHSTLIVYIAGHGGGGKMIVDFKNDDSGAWSFGPEDLGIEQTKACRVRTIIQSCGAEWFQEGLAGIFGGTEHDVVIYSASARAESAQATPGFVTYVPVLNFFTQGGSHFTKRFASNLDIENGDITSVTKVDGQGKTVLIDALADLDAMPPDPFVRPSHPSWCFPECGDDVRIDPEECDGTDDAACPGECTSGCVCPQPACGDNTLDPGEDCDGTDDAACPGLCSPGCSCGAPPVCGDGKLDDGEQCDGDFYCHLDGSTCLSDCTCSNSCTTTSDCGAGQRCYFGTCIVNCMGPGDCPSGQTCSVLGLDENDTFGFGCSVPFPNGNPVGTQCESGASCESYLCDGFSHECTQVCYAGSSPESQCPGGACDFSFPSLHTGFCGTACAGPSSCRTDQRCQFSFDYFSNTYGGTCRVPFGAGEAGDACTEGQECNSLFCGEPPAAQSPCFTNADCSEGGTTCSPYRACVEPTCARLCENDQDCVDPDRSSCTPFDITTPDGLGRQNLGLCGR